MLRANENSPDWHKYVDYVDEMIVAGFHDIVLCSLEYMLANTEHHQKDSLFKAVMELVVSTRVLRKICSYWHVLMHIMITISVDMLWMFVVLASVMI